MYPARDTLQHVIKAWWKVAWQKAGKTLPVFFFVNEHNNTNMKPQAKSNDFQSYPRLEEKQQLVEEKDADNIRKVLCKSFIQWFWELNLCSYKYRVDYFGSLRLSIFFYCCWSQDSRKSKTNCFLRDLTLGKVRFLLGWGGGGGEGKGWPSHFLEWINAWPFRNTQRKTFDPRPYLSKKKITGSDYKLEVLLI